MGDFEFKFHLIWFLISVVVVGGSILWGLL